MSKEPHIHKFSKLVTKRVLLYRQKGSVSAQDIIKLRKCECGATSAYDLERTVV